LLDRTPYHPIVCIDTTVAAAAFASTVCALREKSRVMFPIRRLSRLFYPGIEPSRVTYCICNLGPLQESLLSGIASLEAFIYKLVRRIE